MHEGYRRARARASFTLSTFAPAEQKSFFDRSRVLPKSHARFAASSIRKRAAHHAARGAGPGSAVRQVGGRQDLAAARAAEARPRAAAPLPRAVRRRRRALFRGGAAAGAAQRQQPRAGALLSTSPRRRL